MGINFGSVFAGWRDYVFYYEGIFIGEDGKVHCNETKLGKYVSESGKFLKFSLVGIDSKLIGRVYYKEGLFGWHKFPFA